MLPLLHGFNHLAEQELLPTLICTTLTAHKSGHLKAHTLGVL